MSEKKQTTHQDLVPRGMCPSLVMKTMITGRMDEAVHDGRRWPGDGYYWCLKTCTMVGPDDELVHPGTCGSARRCYDGVPEA